MVLHLLIRELYNHINSSDIALLVMEQLAQLALVHSAFCSEVLDAFAYISKRSSAIQTVNPTSQLVVKEVLLKSYSLYI
jgi:hypothetical protein